jgi:hypothetical protein
MLENWIKTGRLRRISAGIAVFLSVSIFCWAGKTFTMPEVKPAKTYPAYDAHPFETVTIGLDPYDMADKASIFSVRYNEIGFLPILLVITNDSDKPIALSGMKAELITIDRTKISPATEDDLYRRLSRPSANMSPSPIPFPRSKVKGAVGKDALNEIQNARFAARAVEPHSTQAGFLFFDVSGISTPLAGAHFYLSGAHDADGNELMYFEVAMEKYLSAPASTPATK